MADSGHVQGSDLPRALRLARTGEQEGYAAIWAAFSPRVAGYVRGQGPDVDVDEVTSQVFLEVFADLPSPDGGPEQLMALLLTVARRRAIDARRAAARRRRLMDRVRHDPAQVDRDRRSHPSAEVESVDRDARARVDQLLSCLPDDQREVLLMRAFGDLTIETIAAHMGRSVGAVKALQRRGLERLRRHPDLYVALGLAEEGGQP